MADQKLSVERERERGKYTVAHKGQAFCLAFSERDKESDRIRNVRENKVKTAFHIESIEREKSGTKTQFELP